jgi:hypothetical protein
MLVVENRFHSLYFSRPLIEPAKLQVSRARLQAAPQTQARPGAGQAGCRPDRAGQFADRFPTLP